MNYQEGSNHVRELVAEYKISEAAKTNQLIKHRLSDRLEMQIPGYKGGADYCLLEDQVAPKHTDIVDAIYLCPRPTSLPEIGSYLSEVYNYGLKARTLLFDEHMKAKIFWISLQEDLNYPPPNYLGRRMPFQRYFEAALAREGLVSIELVRLRAETHGRPPPLGGLQGITLPPFF